MTHGVIGNTSDFGSEESRFETWWVNKTFSFLLKLEAALQAVPFAKIAHRAIF
jgi:hypothetical protein